MPLGGLGGGVFGLGLPGGSVAFDGGIGVGIEDGGLSGGLAVVDDRQGSRGRRVGVVAHGDVVPHEQSIDLVQTPVEAEGTVLVHAPFGLEQEQVVEVEVGGGKRTAALASAHWSRGVWPSPRPRWGVVWYSPSTQAHRVRFSASRLASAASPTRLSQPARTVRKKRSIFPLPWG